MGYAELWIPVYTGCISSNSTKRDGTSVDAYSSPITQNNAVNMRSSLNMQPSARRLGEKESGQRDKSKQKYSHNTSIKRTKRNSFTYSLLPLPWHLV